MHGREGRRGWKGGRVMRAIRRDGCLQTPIYIKCKSNLCPPQPVLISDVRPRQPWLMLPMHRYPRLPQMAGRSYIGWVDRSGLKIIAREEVIGTCLSILVGLFFHVLPHYTCTHRRPFVFHPQKRDTCWFLPESDPLGRLPICSPQPARLPLCLRARLPTSPPARLTG